MSLKKDDNWGSLVRTDHNSQELVFDDPLDYLKSATQGIGFMERLKLNWRNSKEISSHIEGIASSLLRQQRADIENQIMFELDIKQKRRFSAYLSEVKEVENSIFAETEEAKKHLVKYMVEQLTEMRKGKATDIKEFTNMVNSGDILPEDGQFLIDTVTELTDTSSENIKQKFVILLTQHADTYKETLTNIREKVISDKW